MSTIRLLIAEDNADMRVLWSLQLKKAGIESVFAGTALEAIGHFHNDAGLSALLSDFSLPDLSGADLISKVRLIRPGFPCVLVTGHSKESVKDGLPADVPVLTKPVQIEDLLAAVRSVL